MYKNRVREARDSAKEAEKRSRLSPEDRTKAARSKAAQESLSARRKAEWAAEIERHARARRALALFIAERFQQDLPELILLLDEAREHSLKHEIEALASGARSQERAA